jgi:hypothetical protein
LWLAVEEVMELGIVAVALVAGLWGRGLVIFRIIVLEVERRLRAERIRELEITAVFVLAEQGLTME